MKKYHIIYQTADGIAQDVIGDWGWIADKLATPPAEGESYTIFVCMQPGCKEARNHARTWHNVFDAWITESARRSRAKREDEARADRMATLRGLGKLVQDTKGE